MTERDESLPGPLQSTDAERSLQPEDVRRAASLSCDALARIAAADWNRPATGLEWDRRRTLEHITAALDMYALNLATPEPVGLRIPSIPRPDCALEDVLTMLRRRANVLAALAAAADPSARGFHGWGRPDPPGYIAMGCAEILLHTDDIVRGIGAPFQAPEALCRRVVARLFPWAPTDVDGWSSLKWASGRLTLSGRDPAPADWAWHASPISEWDGTIKTHGSYARTVRG